MAKLTLTDLSSLANDTSAVTKINTNNAAIETAMENTLSRDGTTPNTMSANIDLNTHDLINAGLVECDELTVAGIDVVELAEQVSDDADAAAASATAAASSASSASSSASAAAASAASAAAEVATHAALTATHGVSSAIVGRTETQTLTNKTINLASNTVTGTLAEFNTAVSDANLASLAGSETLTNKTIALGSNTISGSLSDFNTALTGADFASLAGAETLTNKTLTSPTINGGSFTGGTDIAVADGGTGASTAAGAATNLGLGTGDTVRFAKAGIGGALTDGTLHVLTASAGTVAAHTDADEAVFENSGNGGISVLVPSGSTAYVMLGDAADNAQAFIRMNHSTNTLSLSSSGGATVVDVNSSGRLIANQQLTITGNAPQVLVQNTGGDAGLQINSNGAAFAQYLDLYDDTTHWYVANKNSSPNSGFGIGTSNNGGMLDITTSGEVTMPLQPAVLAHAAAEQTDCTGDATLVDGVAFATEIFDQGGDWATPTFTAPVSGRYRFNINLATKGYLVGHTGAYVKLVTSNRSYAHYFNGYLMADTLIAGQPPLSFSFLVDMDASDTAKVQFQVNGSTKVIDIVTGIDTCIGITLEC